MKDLTVQVVETLSAKIVEDGMPSERDELIRTAAAMVEEEVSPVLLSGADCMCANVCFDVDDDINRRAKKCWLAGHRIADAMQASAA